MWTERAGPPPAHAPRRRGTIGFAPRRQGAIGFAPRVRGALGFTLPEALLALVVVGVGMAGVLLAFGNSQRGAGDALERRQMSAIAQELLEEITLKPYAATANSAPAGCARDTYNDVSDYHGYSSSGVCTVDGVAVPSLASYSVSISVAAGTLGGVAAAKRIVVTVSHGSAQLTLVGWRTDYAS